MIVINELQTIWKGAVVAYLAVLSRNSLVETEEYHKQPRSGQLVSLPGFEKTSLFVRR
jgi:hypothetical protein